MIKNFFRRKPPGKSPGSGVGKNAGKHDCFLELPPDPPQGDKKEQLPIPEGRQGELVRRLRTFLKYNEKKAAFLYELLPQRKKVVYDLVPMMLHLEANLFPSIRTSGPQAPYGVFGFNPTPNTIKSYEEAFPDLAPPQLTGIQSRDPSFPIKSMSLIGSMGSIAQNSKSDFDYWICFDGSSFTTPSFNLFKRKLALIERWAADFAGAEVHLFPVELSKVRMDDFGLTGKESSGSAQAKLLKDEFYRTMTLVAGQVPLWWAMPPGINDLEYYHWMEAAKSSSSFNFDDIVDLGNVHGVSLGELYGAAVWQINKTIGSPFKSVIKLALLEEYLQTRAANGLLCDELKSRILANEEDVKNLDPYVLMFERAASHLIQENRGEDLELLRRSLYLKVGAKLTSADYRQRRLPRKKRVMLQLINNWRWPQSSLESLNNYHNWSFSESLEFSRSINRFIFRTYETVARELNDQDEKESLTITQRDLFVLKRKLFIFYSQRENKVDSIRNVIEAPPPLHGLTIQPFRNETGQMAWGLFRGMLSKEKAAEPESEKFMLKSSPQLAGALIWVVNNRLFDQSTTINLNSGVDEGFTTHVTGPDIQNLLKAQSEFFPFYRHQNLDEESLLNKPKIVRMFLVVNLEEQDKTGNINQLDVCYQNNWGEIFFSGATSVAESLRNARVFLADPRSRGGKNFKIFLSDRHDSTALRPLINKYLNAAVL